MTDRRRAMQYGMAMQSGRSQCCCHNHTAVNIRQTVTQCADNVPVMAFVPWQEWGSVYDEITALCEGTIFEALNKPFLGKRGCCNG